MTQPLVIDCGGVALSLKIATMAANVLNSEGAVTIVNCERADLLDLGLALMAMAKEHGL